MSRSPGIRSAPASIGAILIVVLMVAAQGAYSQVDSTALMLHQRALDLRTPLSVLTLSMRPGEEDLSTLAYLRFGLGARVMSLYVTNGENGEGDTVWEYAPFYAARRRDAAAEAMRSLETEAYFLGMPDLLPDDTTQATGRWRADTLVTRLGRVISQFRPDVVLVFNDRDLGPAGPIQDSLRSGLLRAVRQVADPTPSEPAATRARFEKWSVLRVFEEGKGSLRFPLMQQHPVHRKTYASIGTELGENYGFMAAQRARWDRTGTFRKIYPARGAADKDLDAGRLGLVPSKYAGIASKLSSIATGMLRKGSGRSAVLTEIVAAMDSIEKAMRYVLEITFRDRRVLTQWKVRLEDARVAALGIQVKYVWTETTLTDHQLTFFRVDTILNLPAGGTTELYVPATQSGWGLDENVDPWVTFETHREYRLLSPGGLPRNVPHWQEGLSRFGVGNPFLVAIVHRGKTRERSFMYRITTRFSYSNRFDTEILTPIVRVTPEEPFIVRLTNHSRDGVRDRLIAGDSVVFSPDTLRFWVPRKESSEMDTLVLRGRPDGLPFGNYLIPVRIGPVGVGEFGARHFPAEVDSSRRVAVVTGRVEPPVWQTLRRLGVHSRTLLRDTDLDRVDTAGTDVLIVDRNALVMLPGLRTRIPVLQKFVRDGGHVVILAQDAAVWKTSPLMADLGLSVTPAGRRIAAVYPDSTQFPFSSPNTVGPELVSGWAHRMYYHTVSAADKAVPLRSPAGTPLIVTRPEGRGRWTYVDLALDPQWMNIDPAAFRLLANLVSAR